MWLTSLVYWPILLFINSYKWIELQFLRLASPCLKSFLTRKLETLGVVLHFAGDNKTWTKEEEFRVMKKCQQYDSLLHVQVSNNSFCTRLANRGGLALGEMYMEGGFETSSHEEFAQIMKRISETDFYQKNYLNPVNRLLIHLELNAFNMQTRSKAFEVGQKHYDTGNDIFEAMLDSRMQYTCGYWARADNLEDAQLHKMELIAQKLDLKPGMRVLDIGCGWGSLCKFLAENYGVSCVGITVGEEGAHYAREICGVLPVEIRVQDYRSLNEKFDRIVSVGMFEHVGRHNYKTYMKVVNKCLVDDGIFLLQTIGYNHPNWFRTEPFIHRYIFPNGSIPLHTEIAESIENLLIIEDWHNFGLDYARTVAAWRVNFNKEWPSLKEKYGERFGRMWNFYLSSARGFFLARKFQLWQIVLSKHGLQRDYRAAR